MNNHIIFFIYNLAEPANIKIEDTFIIILIIKKVKK